MVEIEIEGGAMIGYCATASSGIAMAPIRHMNSATTQAKIGLSMKKPGIGVYRCACVAGKAPEAKPDDASALVTGCGRTLSPAANFWKPSTTTLSPAFNPSVTNHWPPCTA